jgi:hypothetical protein
MQFHLYNMSDSLVFSNTMSYDSILSITGVSNAILQIKNDTLFENLFYDFCYKTNNTPIIFNKKEVHYVKQPLLLSNPAVTEHNAKEFLFQKGKDTLQSTIVFYIDTIQQKKFKKSETCVLLTRLSNIPYNKLPICK